VIAWERDDASFPGDLFRSWMEVMLRPVEFFQGLNPAAPLAKPLIFFLIFSVLGSVASTLSWMAVFGDAYNSGAYAWFNFFASPFLAMTGLAINVGFTHVGVLLFVPTRKKVGVTARAYCYVAAPTAMALVPFFGWAVSLVWVFVLSVIGIQQAHETTTGRALAAILVPPFAITMGFTMLVVFLIFLGAALGGQV
jgi:hypothetical protein